MRAWRGRCVMCWPSRSGRRRRGQPTRPCSRRELTQSTDAARVWGMKPLLLTVILAAAVAAHAQSAPSTAPRLTFAFELRVQVGPPLVVGPVAGGTRRIVQILGGTFEGP